jgi:hypothetical protein
MWGLSLENPLILIGLATVLCWFVRSYYTARKVSNHARGSCSLPNTACVLQLKEIPTVGSALPLIGAVQFVRNAPGLVEIGMKKVE